MDPKPKGSFCRAHSLSVIKLPIARMDSPMFQYFVEPEEVLEGWLKESTSKVGIWRTCPRNLRTSMQKQTSAGRNALLARRDFSSSAEIFFPADFIEEVLETFSKRIQMHSFRIRVAAGEKNTKVNPAKCPRPSRVGFGFRVEVCQLELLRR